MKTLILLTALMLGSVSASAVLDSYGGPQNTGRSDFGLGLTIQPHLQWEAELAGPVISSPVVDDNGTMYVGAGSTLQAVSREGALLWSFATSEQIYASPALGPNGTVVVGNLNGDLYGLNTQGQLQWQTSVGAGAERRLMSAPVIDASGRVMVGAWDGRLYAYTTQGNLDWTFAPGNDSASPLMAPLAVDGSGHVVVATADDTNGELWVVETDTGQQRTTGGGYTDRPLGTQVALTAGAVLDLANNRIYFSFSHADEGRLFAYALDSLATNPWFSMRRTYAVVPAGISATPAVGTNGDILVPCLDGRLYALDHQTGNWKWSYGADVEGLFVSPAVSSNGTILLKTMDYKLRALNPDGTERWQWDLPAQVTAPPVLTDDNTICLATQAGTLLCLVERMEVSAVALDGVTHEVTLRWSDQGGDYTIEASDHPDWSAPTEIPLNGTETRTNGVIEFQFNDVGATGSNRYWRLAD